MSGGKRGPDGRRRRAARPLRQERARPLVLGDRQGPLILVAVLISIGLIAVAAASPAAGQRYSGGGVSVRRSTISTAS
jgi:hypothetical protein